ncbi:MAG TPA: efflux transporter outer membrane subunit [Steroidobacteraceae bacterium]|jgi:multidrug efflux system outer membrane protein|nr:efflux transporter outer membrane subunit [Steroidobacteraceae bacterium]
MSKLTLLAALPGALLAACSLAPRYQPPAPPEVVSYKEMGSWVPAVPSQAQSDRDWWMAFGDPSLATLERSLEQSNPDLRAALARFQQAQAIAGRARSNLFPTVGADVSAARQRGSANAPLASVLGGAGTYDDFLATLNLSWEIDLFGRLRNTAAAAGAQAQASGADLAALRLSLQAELASDYFLLRGAEATERVLTDAIGNYDHAYELTHDRYQQGTAAATDVEQADTQRQTARAQLAATQLQRAQLEHAIAVLLGEVPSRFSLAAGQLAGAPPPIAVGLPSTLLQRRPDVAAAERRMAAANAQIGVARAAWFPVFSLAGAAGYESIAAGSWLSAPSRLWSIGPSMQVPLLDAGARAAVNRQARAAYDETVDNYRKVTLTAYQEVEDNLAGLHYLADQLRADRAATASAQSAAYHADQRYDTGVADYIEVTTTHNAALQAQRDTIDVRVAQLNAAVALIRATGGGWTADTGGARVAQRQPVQRQADRSVGQAMESGHE